LLIWIPLASTAFPLLGLNSVRSETSSDKSTMLAEVDGVISEHWQRRRLRIGSEARCSTRSTLGREGLVGMEERFRRERVPIKVGAFLPRVRLQQR
jgi:hypothetical protein